MIYLCQSCGWRINERIKNKDTPENIGKHLLYKGRAFCSKNCIEFAKENPKILDVQVIPSNLDEAGWTDKNRPNGIANWKTERKINKANKK